MSNVKCIGLMAATGAVVSGGMSLYNGIKARKAVIAHAQKISDTNGGRIPTGGMTKDGALWDGFTTVDAVKKQANKKLALISSLNAISGAIGAGIISGLTLLAKAKLK